MVDHSSFRDSFSDLGITELVVALDHRREPRGIPDRANFRVGF